MASRTLIGYLARHAHTRPAGLAVACGTSALTYSELWERALRAGNVLHAHGIGRGDRVVLAASRDADFLAAYFACHLLHAIVVPHEPDIVLPKLRSVVAQLGARLALTSRKTPPLADGSLGCPSLALAALAESDAPAGVHELVEPSPDDIADVLLTSGTTGTAKGVMLTHGNILAAARNINQFIGNTADDREALALPLNHSFGLGRARCQILAGGALVLTAGFQFPKQLFEDMRRWGATGLSFVPAAWAMLVRLTGERLAEFAPQLRYIEIGSAAMPRIEKERLLRLFPHTRICMHYGLTEASRSTFIEFHESRDRLDSVGRPTPNVEIRIVDDDGAERPPREVGRIGIRGAHVMRGYWGNPLGERLQNAVFYSGDLGYRDEDGFVYLSGRADDVINVGGRKVYPTEVEEALLRHHDIGDAVCVGVPDALTGETVAAFLVAKRGASEPSLPLPAPPPSAESLADFLRGKLEPYKIPVAFEWIAAIPRNAGGKVDRKAARALLDRPAARIDAGARS